jgi:hypothetical protein
VGKVPDVVTERIALIVMLRLPVAVWGVGAAESVTVTVKVEVPGVVGTPVITPAELRVSPPGRLPEVTAHMYGAVPPDAFKVVVG